MWTVFVGMSTLTVLTPSTLVSAPSMACWQCSHEMSGATRVVDSMMPFLLYTNRTLHARLLIARMTARDRIQLDQLLNDFILAITFDSFGNAGSQVTLQNNRLELLQRFAYSVGLP